MSDAELVSGSMDDVPRGSEYLGDEVMSNLDHDIDAIVEEALRADPNHLLASYPGWEFYGVVWFDGVNFKCRVKQRGWHVATLVSPSLKAIMQAACERFGYD